MDLEGRTNGGVELGWPRVSRNKTSTRNICKLSLTRYISIYIDSHRNLALRIVQFFCQYFYSFGQRDPSYDDTRLVWKMEDRVIARKRKEREVGK